MSIEDQSVTSDENISMVHIFVWSLPNEPRIEAEWRRIHKRFHVYPLSYAALVTARELFAEHEFSDIASLVTPEDRKELFKRAGDLSEHMVQTLKQSAYPWVAATDYLQLINASYAFMFWRALIRAAKKRNGEGLILHFDFFSKSAVPGQIIRDQRFLDLAIDEANGWVSASWKRRCLDVASRFTWSIVNPLLRDTRLCVSTHDESRDHGEFDLIVLALDESDRRIQAPLVSRLFKQSDNKLKWMTVADTRTSASQDEKELDVIKYGEGDTEVIPIDLRVLSKYRSPLFEKAAQRILIREYSRGLGSFFNDEISSLVLNRLAGLLCKQHEHLRLYHGVTRIFAGKQCKALMMNSSYADMMTPQVWAERQNIPLIRMPHGAENNHGPAVQWKSHSIGHYGQASVDELKKVFGPDCRAEPVGALHFGVLAAGKVDRNNLEAPQGPWKIMMILSPGGTLNYPDTASEEEGDTAQISGAVRSVGGEFCLRCHPRQVNSNYYDYLLMHRRFGVDDWNISNGSDSLIEAMKESAVIITRLWSGASVQCLYGDKPMIAWMPRPGLATGDAIMNNLPCRAGTQEELEACLNKLKTDKNYYADVIRKQRELLAYYINNPFDDPYADAEKFVLKTMGEIKEKSNASN